MVKLYINCKCCGKEFKVDLTGESYIYCPFCGYGYYYYYEKNGQYEIYDLLDEV